jgi:hypothetical protein
LNLKVSYWWRALLVLFLAFSVASIALAQKSMRTKRGSDTDLSRIVRPQLINANTDPTLRFPVMSMPGSVFSITYGWLDITSNTVRYTVVQPLSKSDHAFEVSKFEIGELRFNRRLLSFKSPKKRQILIYLPQDRWGSVHSGPGMSSAASRESLGTSSIYKTFLNYDGVLALVKPPLPPLPPAPVIAKPVATPRPPKPAAPPSPPTIVLSSPPGAEPNQILEVQDPTLVIRGVTMDSTGIPVVNINGSPANMRPQTLQAAEFWSDPLPLQAGTNYIQVVASNSAHVEAKLELTVHYTPKQAPPNPRALDRQEIITLLQGGVPAGHIADLIRERGLKFSPSADDLEAIRAAGGTDEVIEAIQKAATSGR